MSWLQMLELYDLLDDPNASGEKAAEYLRGKGIEDVSLEKPLGDAKNVTFVKAVIPGTSGRRAGGSAPTLGIVGRLGGIGARPARIGFTSDGDGALSALTIAAKLGMMAARGDKLPGDVIVTTQVCPDAPTRPHDPVPFMDSPVSSAIANAYEVTPEMEAILSIDTTKGNRIVNHRGIAVTPTVKDGWILRTAEPVLDILTSTTGKLPVVLPITQQDITPYGNGIYHLNSILQPSVATAAPVIGVAITAVSQVAGCATGATHMEDVDEAVRFSIEVAKAFGAGQCPFYDAEEYARLLALYGPLSHFRTMGGQQ